MTKISLICALVLATACTDKEEDPEEPALDPTGNWSVTYAFAPSCGNAASTTTGTFTVTLDGQGYNIVVIGVQSTGSLVCTADVCKLSGTFAWMASGATHQQSMNLTLDVDSRVGGNGTETVITPDRTCTYPFTVTGTKS